MPRGKKARNPDDESKEKEEVKEEPKEEVKVKGKRGKKTVPSVEEVKTVETTIAEVEDCIRAHLGAPDCSKKLKELLHNSTTPRGLINAAIAVIFELVQLHPTQLNWGKSLIESISSDLMEPKKDFAKLFFFLQQNQKKNLFSIL